MVTAPAPRPRALRPSAAAWPPPTRSGWAWVGFALGALLILAALVAAVAARLGLLVLPS